jgi:hypothetical protein
LEVRSAAYRALGEVAVNTRRAHRWIKDACTRCGLRQRETWVLDDVGRPVMALVWADASGDRQVRPLPVFKGVEPPTGRLLTVGQAFPGVPIGPEPPCDRSARARAVERPQGARLSGG